MHGILRAAPGLRNNQTVCRRGDVNRTADLVKVLFGKKDLPLCPVLTAAEAWVYAKMDPDQMQSFASPPGLEKACWLNAAGSSGIECIGYRERRKALQLEYPGKDLQH